MRRLTILLAALAALMLVPATQAFAEDLVFIKGTGTGSGEVVGIGEELAGEPPIACSYTSPGPATGICSTDPFEFEEESGFYAVKLQAKPTPGSEFAGWTLLKGASTLTPGSCPSEKNPLICEYFTFIEEFEVSELQATFTKEVAAGPELTVTPEGTGTGTVVSSPAGIECGGTCSAQFEENTKVTLTASPSAGSTFVSWKGCEKGGAIGRQCTVTMDKAKTVNAKFALAYDVTVNRVGTGLGKVQSAPSGILCLANCASTKAAFKESTSVTLTATPSKNYVFTEWTGDCSGSGTCSLSTLSANKTVGAKFTAVAQHNLSLSKSGGGNGTVKAAQAGINCGATCLSQAAAYFQGTVVELTATPGKGSSFGGWSGGGCSGTGTCTVTMSAAKSVTAEFK